MEPGPAATARIATTADADAVAALLHAFNLEYDEPSPGVPFLAGRLRELLGSPHAYGVVAGDPIESFGLVTLRPSWWADGQIALLDELYTVPPRRGCGLGAAVLETVIAEARRRCATELVIEVDEPDHDAHRFYARHGFPLRDPATGQRAFAIRAEL